MIGADPMMNERPVESATGFAAGLLTGMVCGGALALLFAPKAGAELRGELSGSMCAMRDAMGRGYREVADRASAGVGQMKDKAQVMAAGARDFVQTKRQQGRGTVEQATQH